jgi:hypothetical protein
MEAFFSTYYLFPLFYFFFNEFIIATAKKMVDLKLVVEKWGFKNVLKKINQ